MHYMADPATYRRAATDVTAAAIAPSPGRPYRLADVAAAHRDLEAGSLYLIP
jgi:hypothetical protein